MEYAIDKLEDLGLRKLAGMVLEKEEEIIDLKKEITGLKNLYKNMEIAFNNAEERIDEANKELDYMMDNVDIPTYCGIKIKQILKGDSNV